VRDSQRGGEPQVARVRSHTGATGSFSCGIGQTWLRDCPALSVFDPLANLDALNRDHLGDDSGGTDQLSRRLRLFIACL
jgi:hypothetical protein